MEIFQLCYVIQSLQCWKKKKDLLNARQKGTISTFHFLTFFGEIGQQQFLASVNLFVGGNKQQKLYNYIILFLIILH